VSTLLLRVAAIAALAFSSAAAVDYYGQSHPFCASGSGCDAVRHSDIGRSLGQALPLVGMLGFAFVLLASTSRRASIRLMGLAAAAAGGVAGLALLALQLLSVGAFCSLCVGVDVAAVMAALAAFPSLRARGQGHDVPPSPRAAAVVRAAAAVAVGAPLVWALSATTEVPPYIRGLGKPGKINVIELSDFQCPYCRALHPALTRAMRPYGGRVHFVRKSYPLPHHTHARDAARAYLCALEQGRGEAMADALFEARDLSAASTVAMAAELQLDTGRFAGCISDAATDARVDEDMRRIREADFEGLPTVWIGSQRLLGFDREAGAGPYERALAAAARGDDRRTPWGPAAALTALVLILLTPALRKLAGP
jgi:protein-disulfide isomerase